MVSRGGAVSLYSFVENDKPFSLYLYNNTFINN